MTAQWHQCTKKRNEQKVTLLNSICYLTTWSGEMMFDVVSGKNGKSSELTFNCQWSCTSTRQMEDSKSKINFIISIGDNVELAYYWKGESAKQTQTLWITLLGASHQARWPSTVNLYSGGSLLKFLPGQLINLRPLCGFIQALEINKSIVA
jgi:hypothetical protein